MTSICAENIRIFGCKFDQTVPATFGVGGAPAFYRKVAWENPKTVESLLHLTYNGTLGGGHVLAYRFIGRTATGMIIAEDVIITSSEVTTVRGDFRFLDKIERLSPSFEPLVTDGLFLDIDGDGHIDSRQISLRANDGVLSVREGGAGGKLLGRLENAANNQVPDAREPSPTNLYGEEILVFQRLYHDIINDANVPYYQKVYLINQEGYAVNDGTVRFISENIDPQQLSLDDGSLMWGTDAHNNGTLQTSGVKEAPAGVSFVVVPIDIPGATGDLIGSLDSSHFIGIWISIDTARAGVIDFDASIAVSGISDLNVVGFGLPDANGECP